MEEIQKLLEMTLKEVPLLVLEKRLAEKVNEAGLTVDKTILRKAAKHILSGSRETFQLDGNSSDVNIQITNDDLEYVVKAVERFYKEQLVGVVAKTADNTANLMLNSLSKRWPEEFQAQRADMDAFRERLERRWGKGLGRLRMLLTIVREWAQGVHERSQRNNGGKPSRLEEVMLRLHARACQVTSEIIVLLENGYADGAMARWRTLHEIATVAAIISRFGDEIAERYVYYQIVESFEALKAYERNHKDLGYRPPSKKQSLKVRKDYKDVIKRFGKKFGDENGWAAQHLNLKEKERVTFARLEQEIGDAFMRSPYKMASYNVHAGPKGVYFKLGTLDGSPAFLAGASNAGLIEPAQHAAVSLAEITMLIIGDSMILDDLVVARIVSRLEAEIPPELAKAHSKLRRDARRYRRNAQKTSIER